MCFSWLSREQKDKDFCRALGGTEETIKREKTFYFLNKPPLSNPSSLIHNITNIQ
jgi:hypothetical protein